MVQFHLHKNLNLFFRNFVILINLMRCAIGKLIPTHETISTYFIFMCVYLSCSNLKYTRLTHTENQLRLIVTFIRSFCFLFLE